MANEIPSTNRCSSEYIRLEIPKNFFASTVSEDEIRKIVCNFKDSVARWDGLRPHIMKLIQNNVKSPLAHVCNRSFVTGIFPSELKVANVLQYSYLQMIWYFPIIGLFLCYLCCQDILEILIYNRLVLEINHHDLLYEYQFEFQQDKSTHMAPITLIDPNFKALGQINPAGFQSPMCMLYDHKSVEIRYFWLLKSIWLTSFAFCSVASYRSMYCLGNFGTINTKEWKQKSWNFPYPYYCHQVCYCSYIKFVTITMTS